MAPTPQQSAVFSFVAAGEGHGIIDAVAGAGKTTTLLEALAHVPADKSALFCAFNTTIAREMRRRLMKGGLRTEVKTVHALGRKCVATGFGDSPPDVREGKQAKLYEGEAFQTEALDTFNSLLELERIDPTRATQQHPRVLSQARRILNRVRRRVLESVDLARATLMPDEPGAYAALVEHFGIFSAADMMRERVEREIGLHYDLTRLLLRHSEELARESQVIDFADMIYLPAHWGLEAPYRADFLFVDECQDLSRAQLATLLKYGHPGTRVLAVGDPQQSVYGFTGADLRSFHRIEETLKAQRLPLSTCFRCPGKVIDVARAFRPDIEGAKEAPGIVEEIAPADVLDALQPGDLVVSRLKAPLHGLLYLLLERERKVRIHPDEVESVLLSLRSPFTKRDLNARIGASERARSDFFESARRRGYSDIERDARRISDPDRRQLVVDAEKLVLDGKLDFLHGRLAAWGASAKTLHDVLEEIRRRIQATKGAIALSTIHRAKGLENDRVFVLAYDELPYTRPGVRGWQAEQELNLQYVAVTRAREALYLVCAVGEEGGEGEGGGEGQAALAAGSLYDALLADGQSEAAA